MPERVNLNCKEIILKNQYNPKTKPFHIHDRNVDLIRSIRVHSAEVGLTHADVDQMAVRRLTEGR